MATHRTARVLPGFGLSLGYTLVYLSLIVLIPLSATFLKTAGFTWEQFWHAVTSPRVVASYRITFGASFVGAVINAVFGLLVAWVLVRYRFPGRRIIDAIVDLPFALPTAVAGIALTAIYSQNGWIGQYIVPLSTEVKKFFSSPEPHTGLFGWIANYLAENGLDVAFTPVGVTLALTFIGLPFVVRTVQPVLEELQPEVEQAAATLGANRWQTITRVVLPEIWPALLTGFALAFARAVGEYGSVVFISGNKPLRTEITPLLIITKLEQFDYRGATALAVVMLVTSFVLLLIINLLQRWLQQRTA
ncbi:MAG TPA: sulfate ABC transporter permease subunit CysT [Chthoniobacterales bacterium]